MRAGVDMPKSFGAKPAGFLAARALPVDGYKIRNSLYLTQPLRSPAQAALNVISREDTSLMQEEAKYAGMAQASRRLMESINQAHGDRCLRCVFVGAASGARREEIKEGAHD